MYTTMQARQNGLWGRGCHLCGAFDPVLELDSQEVVLNGQLMSFEYKRRQVDVIRVKDEASLFYSYGDIGMILGMMCKSVGLLLNDRSLYIRSKAPHSDHKHLLSTEIDQTLEFLGLKMHIWQQGFASEQSVFEWIASSRFFNGGMFTRQLKGGTNKRVEVRPMFRDFLSYCHTNQGNCTAPVDHAKVFDEAMEFFGRANQYQQFLSQQFLAQQLHDKFNGDMVMQLTGLKGKELGMLMKEFRSKYNDDDIQRMHDSDVREKINDVLYRLSTIQSV